MSLGIKDLAVVKNSDAASKNCIKSMLSVSNETGQNVLTPRCDGRTSPL